jgi:hypothetical protein
MGLMELQLLILTAGHGVDMCQVDVLCELTGASEAAAARALLSTQRDVASAVTRLKAMSTEEKDGAESSSMVCAPKCLGRVLFPGYNRNDDTQVVAPSFLTKVGHRVY